MHLEQINDLKPNIDPILGPTWPNCGPNHFFLRIKVTFPSLLHANVKQNIAPPQSAGVIRVGRAGGYYCCRGSLGGL